MRPPSAPRRFLPPPPPQCCKVEIAQGNRQEGCKVKIYAGKILTKGHFHLKYYPFVQAIVLLCIWGDGACFLKGKDKNNDTR